MIKKFLVALAALATFTIPTAHADHNKIMAPWVCNAEDPAFVAEFLNEWADSKNFSEFADFLQSEDLVATSGQGNCVVVRAVTKDAAHVEVTIERVYDELEPLALPNGIELLPLVGTVGTAEQKAAVILAAPVELIEQATEGVHNDRINLEF